MGVQKPLGAALFIYELLRLLLLAALAVLFLPSEESRSGFFPFLAFMSPNALFPLMALFLFLRAREYRSYAPLYLAGKIIAAAAFYTWIFLSFRRILEQFFMNLGEGNLIRASVLLGGTFVLALGDAFSIIGACFLEARFRIPAAGEGEV